MAWLGLFFLAVCAITDAAPHGGLCKKVPAGYNECKIAGTWADETSKSDLFFTCKDGEIKGTYNFLPTNDAYDIVGRYTLSGPKNKTCEFAWAADWNNKHDGNYNSVTAWSGIHYADEGIIHGLWIATTYQKRKDLWKSHLINQDTMKRSSLC